MEQWLQWAEGYENLPFIRKISWTGGNPPTWEPFKRQKGQPAFVLESAKGGRYTYFGDRPAASITGKGDFAVIRKYANGSASESAGTEISRRTVSGRPLQLVKEWMKPYRSPRVAGAPPFTGGCVGFWGYDVARSIERLPVLAADDLGLPDYDFFMLRRVWSLDLQEQALYCSVYTQIPPFRDGESKSGALEQLYRQAEAETARMAAEWEAWHQEAERHEDALQRRAFFDAASRKDGLRIDIEAMEGIEVDFPKDRFLEAVRRIQQYIAQGDVFQVNLSVRQSRKLQSSSEDIYEWLRMLNPSPYMAFLQFPEYELVSGSPELLVRLLAGTLETRPIAGTRPRGGSREEDMRLAGELIANEKERAEHIMLVDLLRNDLGRVSRYGTVQVTDLMTIEYYSHVMHIVSHVKGELAAGKDAFDAIAAVFPGGTITGAPKIRTMEIIEELEPFRRGPYTGSIGWIDYNGDMELNIIIRTLVVKDGKGYVQAGAGIVIDSLPEKEYAESLNKAKALWKAIQYSENRGAEPR
jgi:para-aminobenzoate synthetase component 1